MLRYVNERCVMNYKVTYYFLAAKQIQRAIKSYLETKKARLAILMNLFITEFAVYRKEVNCKVSMGNKKAQIHQY